VGTRRRHGDVVAAGALAVLAASVPHDALGQAVATSKGAAEVTLAAAPRPSRRAAWAEALPFVEVMSAMSRASSALRLYTSSGALDATARTRFEVIAGGDGEAHELSPRLEQLVFKAAYHFAAARVIIVSGYREHAGRHTAGEALDFKLSGVRAAELASFLRGLPRVGVGIYTHPRTQYVHLDVRETSYHWLDASPPGITWKERQLRDPGQARRDATWTAEADLPG
jgi:uncharacterized protein YcbK (DUF882 family)